VIRTSNAYAFSDPQAVNSRPVPSKSENQSGTQYQEDLTLSAPACGKLTTDTISTPLERALARFGAALAAKTGIEQGAASYSPAQNWWEMYAVGAAVIGWKLQGLTGSV
jgi:hypothetical protein